VTADRRRSPLADWAERFAAVEVHSGGKLRLAEVPFVPQVNVRATPEGRSAAGDAFGVALPTHPNTVTRAGDTVALWLGPDEWLVLNQPCRSDGEGWSAVDVGALRTTVAVGGSAILDLLAHGCALDVAALTGAWCAQTLLARARVILLCEAPDDVRILVVASFANYVADWLLDAANEWTTGTTRS